MEDVNKDATNGADFVLETGEDETPTGTDATPQPDTSTKSTIDHGLTREDLMGDYHSD